MLKYLLHLSVALLFITCKTESSKVKTIIETEDKAVFSSVEEAITKSKKPVVVYFWANWCGPCKTVSPIIKELRKKYKGKVVIDKVNVDINPEFTSKNNIRNIPAVLIFKNGKLVDKITGANSKTTYIARINNTL